MEVVNAEDNFLCCERAGEIKEEFLKLYPKMGELLSASHFVDILDIVTSDGVTVKTDAAVDIMKTRLTNNLKVAFNQMWDFHSITPNLSILEYLKNKYKNRTKPQWRPYGKTVQEQTLPLRIKMLERKGLYLEKQLAFQKGKIEDIIARVESTRKYIEEVSQRRSQLSYAIDLREDRFPQLKEEIRDLQLKSIDMIYS